MKTWEIDRIEKAVNEKFCVLDVGCGIGASIARVQSRYPNVEVYGIEKLKVAAEFAAGIGTVVAEDVCRLEENHFENKFDHILTGGIWEHIETGKLESVFRQLKAMAAAGCTITGSIYNRNHPWHNCIPDEQKNRDIGIGDVEHVASYTAEEWIEILSQNGIKVEDFCFSREKHADLNEEPYQYFWKGYFV